MNGHRKGEPLLHGEVPAFSGRGPVALVVNSGVSPMIAEELKVRRYPKGMKVRVVFADDRGDLPPMKGTGTRVVRTLSPQEASAFRHVDAISPRGGNELELTSCMASEVGKMIRV